MNQIKFLVQGSADAPYEVVFSKVDRGLLYASCSCEAGLRGMHCKHRILILEGNAMGIVSDNMADISTVQSWLKGTALESALMAVWEHEDAVAEAQRELRLAKKGLARVMVPPK